MANRATDSALALLTAAVAGGVRHVVVMPGSRSQALALLAAQFERLGLIRLKVAIDERSGSFYALGVARESGRPAVVICTSGTAAANLSPAAHEAHAARIPAIFLTADRPQRLHGVRANQTMAQLGVLGREVPARDFDASSEHIGFDDEVAHEATDSMRWALDTARSDRGRGPVQLNVRFDEPLSETLDDQTVLDAVARARASTRSAAQQSGADAIAGSIAQLADDALPTIVIAGADAGPRARQIAEAMDWPIAAEVTSGARSGRNVVVAYRQLLDDERFGGQVARVLVFGHPTLSRQATQLVARESVEVIVVDSSERDYFNVGRTATRVPDIALPELLDVEAKRLRRAMLRAWVSTSHDLIEASSAEPPAPTIEHAQTGTTSARRSFLAEELRVLREPITREMLAHAVWGVTWPNDRLVLGASRLIRVFDEVVAGRAISAHANRGLAGIDGTVATALGVAAAAADAANAEGRRVGVTRAVMGDLTAVHDASSFALARDVAEDAPRLLVIVGNDGGGSIFDTLEVRDTAHTTDFARVQRTAVTVDFEALARTFGWAFERVHTRSTLERALTAAVVGPTLLEVVLDAAEAN